MHAGYTDLKHRWLLSKPSLRLRPSEPRSNNNDILVGKETRCVCGGGACVWVCGGGDMVWARADRTAPPQCPHNHTTQHGGRNQPQEACGRAGSKARACGFGATL